jgi:hypothetical protein
MNAGVPQLMNDKNISIKQLVDNVLNEFGHAGIKVKDFWEADLCAVGFTDHSEQFLLYVSTYGQKRNEYFVSLENPPLKEATPYKTKFHYDKINLNQLKLLISEHLIRKD